MDCLLISPSCGVNEVRQTEIHKAELPVPDPSALEVEVGFEKLKSHKSSSIDQIPAELRQGVEQFAILRC